MNSKRVISLFMILSILIVSGCKINIGTPAKEGESSDASNDEKDEKINKNDIDKIEVNFSEDDGKFCRTMTIEPKEDKIECRFKSICIDEELTAELDQENYDKICESIKSFNDMGWSTSDLSKYETDNYKVKKLGACSAKIDSKVYPLDASSTEKNMCCALLCQLLNTLFPLKWNSSLNDEFDKYYKIFIGNSSGDFENDVLKDYRNFNYAAGPNYFNNDDSYLKSIEDIFGIKVDKSQKYIEYAQKGFGEKRGEAFICMSSQQPLEHEYFAIIKKFDIEMLMSKNELDKIKLDGKTPIEPIYKFEVVDKQEQRRDSYLKKETFEKLDENDVFGELSSWLANVSKEFM